MAVYTYTCHEGHSWDESRPMGERDEPAVCPECGAEGKRGFSAPVIPWFAGCTRSEDYYQKRGSKA